MTDRGKGWSSIHDFAQGVINHSPAIAQSADGIVQTLTGDIDNGLTIWSTDTNLNALSPTYRGSQAFDAV